MQGSRRHIPSRARLVREDDGFGLIEVMVSAILVVVLGLAALKLIDSSQLVSSNNRSRDVAAQLAQSEQDAIRQMPITALAGGYHPGTAQKQVGGITYTVDSSADWVQDSGGPVTCSTSGAVSYLSSTTSVTWPGMGAIKPVTADAVVDPGVAALGAKKGALTVLLSRADGTGAADVVVTVEGVSSVTDENGCAVIGNLDVGNQTLTYADAAFVDKDSKTAVSKVVTIGAGTISQTSALYDNPGTVNLSGAKDPSALSLMAWNGKFTLDQTLRSTPTVFSADGGSAGTKTLGLFPFPSSYKVYAGDCTGNDPSNTAYANAGSPQGVQLNRGDVKGLALTLPTSTVKVFAGGATSSGSATSILVAPETAYAPMAACTAPIVKYTNTNGAVDKNYLIQVPYGVWRVCANYKYGPTDGNKWVQKKTVAYSLPNSSLDQPLVATTPSTTGTYAKDLVTQLTISGSPPNGSPTTEPTTC